MSNTVTSSSAYFARQMFILSVTGAPQEGAYADEVPALFAELAQDIYVAAGEPIYKKGDDANSLFFLVSGEVDIDGKQFPKPGEVFGGRDSFAVGKFTNDATAKSDVHVLRVPADAWLEFLEDHFDAMCIVMRNVARRNLGRHARRPFVNVPRSTMQVLSIADRMLLLRNVPPFASASVQALATLAQACDTRELAEGESLPCVSEREYLHVLVDGAVDLVAKDRTEHLEGTGCVNLPEAFGSELADCKTVAKKPSFLFLIALEDVLDVMEEHFELAKATLILLQAE